MSGDKRKGGAKRPRPTPPDAEILRGLYCELGHTQRQIAKMFGVSQGLISKWMVQHEIPVRESSEVVPSTLTPHPDLPGVMIVSMIGGHSTIVDAEDQHLVSGYSWLRVRAPGRHARLEYAYAYVRDSSGVQQRIFLHRHLYGLTKTDRVMVDHKNHDGLDNRRTNLRLATAKQNGSNVRKTQRATTSSYRGVVGERFGGKWLAHINENGQTFHLGIYAIEEEAAIAFQAVAPLFRDADFLNLDLIPIEKLPSPERIQEIREKAIAYVKAKLEGRKVNESATSQMQGVTWLPNRRKWRAAIGPKINGRQAFINLGSFDSEIAAGYAYDCAAAYLRISRTTNRIASSAVANPVEIQKQVHAKIDAARSGQKGWLNPSSKHSNVSLDKRRGTWAAYMDRDGKRATLGIYPFEHEAAFAANVAAERLGRPTPNVIPDADLPSTERMAEIRAIVLKKLS